MNDQEFRIRQLDLTDRLREKCVDILMDRTDYHGALKYITDHEFEYNKKFLNKDEQDITSSEYLMKLIFANKYKNLEHQYQITLDLFLSLNKSSLSTSEKNYRKFYKEKKSHSHP